MTALTTNVQSPTTPPGDGWAIETRDVGVHYGAAPALLGVTASFSARKVTAIVGPSGCGKTSFLNCLNRMTDLVPGCRREGTAIVGGVDIFDPSLHPATLRRRIGMIFQRPNPFPMSIRANVQLALREHGLRDKRKLEERTAQVLADVGLFEEVKDRLGASAVTLSGGQQQRLCLARAIALEPEVLLMDEPCSALDPIAADRVELLIRSLSRRYTILIVTHNLAQARRLADAVAVFWTHEGVGRLIEQDETNKIFEHPEHPLTAAYVNGRCC